MIQESAIGPASFLVCASDLHPVNAENSVNKYADDCYLIIPASNTSQCKAELEHVEDWAKHNNLKLNTDKTVEMIITAKNKNPAVPPPIPGITRSDTVEMLGVTLSNKLKMTQHINEKIESCSKSLFALKTLKAHGMCKAELYEVFRATTLASLLYAAPAWWGFALAEEKGRLDAFLRKAVKADFYPGTGPTISELVGREERTLFKSVSLNCHHVLHPLLPPVALRTYNLRPRSHPYVIPSSISSMHDRNFIIRMLKL